jgi:alpha-L-rhamnosidase
MRDFQVNRRQLLIATGALAATPPRLLLADSPAQRVVRTRTECIDRPMGLEVAQPRFSWALESTGQGVRQRAYRVVVASSESVLSSGPYLWDSGRIESDRCFDVPYQGHALLSGQRAWWRVEVWTNRDSAPVVAEATWFEMGLLQPGDWLGQWLAIEDAEEKADRAAGLHWVWGEELSPKPRKFRFRCTVSAKPVRAELLLSAKDKLEGVWVNGEVVTLPPSGQIFWGTMLRLPVELVAGANVVCVAATANTQGFAPPDGGALVALLKVTGADGQVTRFATGPDWRTSNSEAGEALPAGGVAGADTAVADGAAGADVAPGWTRLDFDDSGWSSAAPSKAHTQCEPWPAGPAMLVRHEFTVSKPVARARLYATALGAYEARINGRRVGDAHLSPEVSVASDHVFYQCYDATSLLVQGPNAMGALVGDGWYASAFTWQNQRYSLGAGPRRFLAQLIVDYQDGSRDLIGTGSQWRIAASAVRSSEIYNGENYDARAEIPGWDRAGFDAGAWAECAPGEKPALKLLAQIDPPIRVIRTMPVATFLKPRPGVFVCDFGQNFSGWCRLKVSGAAGTAVQLRYAEILQPSGDVDMSNLRGAKATDRYTLRGDPAGETCEPRFTYHGFRYVEITGFPGELTAGSVLGIVVHTDAAVTGEFIAANKTVQAIWNNAFWSQRSNFFGVPTDCPQRDERMGWMGDIQVFLDAAAFNMDVDAFIRRFMTEVRAGQAPDGGFPVVTPQPLTLPEMVTSGWSDAGVILPWTLYRRYGETRVIEENWAAMEGWMRYMERPNPDFIFRHGRGIDLGDWLSVDAKQPADETTPRVLVATAYWAYCAMMMAEMARATGQTEAGERYSRLYANIRKAFVKEFVRPDATVGNGSQTSYVLALRFALVPPEQVHAAGAHLAADIRNRGMKLSTGFLGTPYLLDVLANAGQEDVAVSLLLQTAYPSWGYMLAKGATSMWERWNGDVGDVAMNSYNHYAFGAVVGFMYRRLAGIAPAGPGFRRIDIDPLYDERIGPVEARYDSCVGRIATRVSGDTRGMTRLEVEIPANCVARIRLPKRAQPWREGRRALEGRADVRIVTRGTDGVALEVGSGHYDFTQSS